SRPGSGTAGQCAWLPAPSSPPLSRCSRSPSSPVTRPRPPSPQEPPCGGYSLRGVISRRRPEGEPPCGLGQCLRRDLGLQDGPGKAEGGKAPPVAGVDGRVIPSPSAGRGLADHPRPVQVVRPAGRSTW